MDKLQTNLEEYILDSKNPEKNYELGLEYHKIGNSAAAISYLLRAAELTDDDYLAYTSLLINAINFRKQGRRKGSYRNQLLHAIALCPDQPEGYFMLSRYYQEDKQYHESYAIAKMGLALPNSNKVNELLEYYGSYVLEFEMAVSAWWIGQRDESRNRFRKLLTTVPMVDLYVNSIRSNMKSIGCYTKFEAKTDWNYSQCMQDIFVISTMDYKKNGTYLEIGSADPIYNSNTYLLEKEYGWKGVSVDIDQESVTKFNEVRENKADCMDAKDINYTDVHKKLGKVIDYLQVDCDPSSVSYEILKTIPFDRFIFKCITFEHDYFSDKNDVRDKSRKLLKKNGYVLVADNVGTDINSPFEDWYVHISEFKNKDVKQIVDGENKTPYKYLE